MIEVREICLPMAGAPGKKLRLAVFVICAIVLEVGASSLQRADRQLVPAQLQLEAEVRHGIRKLQGQVEQKAVDISEGKVRKGLFSKTISGISISSKRPQCVTSVHIQPSNVENSAKTLFSNPSFSLTSPECHQKDIVEYSDLGRACNSSTKSTQESFYRKGVVSMLLGATRSEAFAPLIHFRILAANLAACSPSKNTPGSTAVPDSFVGLYQVYETKLLARLESSNSLNHAVSEDDIENFQKKITYKVRRVLSAGLYMDVNSDWFLPTTEDIGEEVYEAYSLGNAIVQSYPAARKIILGSNRQAMTEAECDQNVDPNYYFLHILNNVHDPFEHCCSEPCARLQTSSQGIPTSMETCCRGCNRYTCNPNTPEMVVILGQIATIVSPASNNMDPVAYTFAL